MRIAYVMAYGAASYSLMVNKPFKKPFNPLLGETYELIEEERGFRLVSE